MKANIRDREKWGQVGMPEKIILVIISHSRCVAHIADRSLECLIVSC